MPITPTAKIWMDGGFVDWADATVHVSVHLTPTTDALLKRSS
jgi:hypothetical protein